MLNLSIVQNGQSTSSNSLSTIRCTIVIIPLHAQLHDAIQEVSHRTERKQRRRCRTADENKEKCHLYFVPLLRQRSYWCVIFLTLWSLFIIHLSLSLSLSIYLSLSTYVYLSISLSSPSTPSLSKDHKWRSFEVKIPVFPCLYLHINALFYNF